jgi:hypothetical protein
MKGSLKQRSEGSWTIILPLGRDPVTGKKRQKWHTVNGNKKQAQAELNRLLHELQTGSVACRLRESERWRQDLRALFRHRS